MEINAFREALRKLPFRPFTIRLVDGRAFPVVHRDFVAVTGRSVVVASPDQDETYSLIDSILIVSLDYEAPVATPAAGTSDGGNS